jgi:hypothetical protein
MHYLIYKITNRLDNKFYVGAHKTKNKNDEYFGSGLLLERAVNKHGRENFLKEILFDFQNEDDMWKKEAEIVDEDFISRDDTYNIKLGGSGGWDYIIANKLNQVMTPKKIESCKRAANVLNENRRNKLLDENFRKEYSQKRSLIAKKYIAENGNPFLGRKHSEETKKKMSMARKGKVDGKNNPSYGKHWVTNGTYNKFIPKIDHIPEGFKKGRI